MDLLFAAVARISRAPAQGLKRGHRLLNLGVNVMMCPEFLRETFLFRSASNGRDSKTHASRKLNSEVAKPANSLLLTKDKVESFPETCPQLARR